MIQQAGRPVMVCWTGDSIVGMNAQTGEVYWRQPFKPAKMVINIATPVLENGRLFFTSFYDGSVMLDVSDSELAVERAVEPPGSRRTAYRQPALDHQHALSQGRLCLRRRQLRRVSLSGRQDGRARLGKSRAHAQITLEHDPHGRK